MDREGGDEQVSRCRGEGRAAHSHCQGENRAAHSHCQERGASDFQW